MNWIKDYIINALIISVSAFLGLALFELLLVYEDKSKPFEKVVVNIEGEKYLFIEQQGLHTYFQKQNNRSDIFVIGDSFTQGATCAADKEDFPSQLGKMLPPAFNVINLGVGAKNPADYIDFVANLKLDVNDRIVIVLYDNDIHVSPKNCQQIVKQSEKFDIYIPSFCHKTKTRPLIKSSSPIIDKSNRTALQKINNYLRDYKVVRLVKESLINMPFARGWFYRTEYRTRWNEYNAEENKWLVSTLKVIKDMAQSKYVEVFFTYYPNTNHISPTDARHNQWLEFIKYVEKNTGIKINDPYPYFIEYAPSPSMVWSLTDKHPNCAAHELMAHQVKNIFFHDID